METIKNLPHLEHLKQDPFFAEILASTPWATDLLAQLEAHHPETLTHSARVAKMFYKLASSPPLPQDKRVIVLAGLLHDIGKTEIDTELLNSSGKLSHDQKEIMRVHARKGFEILSEYDEEVAKIAVGHHEHQEGPYPRITPRADSLHKLHRSLALADTTDAYMSSRSYKPALSAQETRKKLIEQGFKEDLVRLAIEMRSSL